MLRIYPSLFIIFNLFFMSSVFAAPVNALFHQAGDPVVGNPRGTVTLVEFFDYQCSHCIAMVSTINSIIRANPNLRVVFKEFPIRGEASELGARAALAAAKQGKYYPFMHTLLINQSLSFNGINQTAESLGLNMAKFRKDISSNAITNILKANFRLADTLNVTGTPAFFIGKTNAKSMDNVIFVLGEMSRSELQNDIDKAARG